MIDQSPSVFSDLNQATFFEMSLGGSNHVLPPFSEVLPVDDAVNSIVAEVGVEGLNLWVQLACRERTAGIQQVTQFNLGRTFHIQLA
jgi:hypothetical protein